MLEIYFKIRTNEKIKENVNIKNNKLYYKNDKLKCIHTF